MIRRAYFDLIGLPPKPEEIDAFVNDKASGAWNRVIERLSEPYVVDNHTLYVGASVGSAVGPRDGCSVEELMRNADLALFSGPRRGFSHTVLQLGV